MNVSHEAHIDQYHAWLAHGIEQGWITPPACIQHEGLAYTEIEETLLEDDMCVLASIVRHP